MLRKCAMVSINANNAQLNSRRPTVVTHNLALNLASFGR